MRVSGSGRPGSVNPHRPEHRAPLAVGKGRCSDPGFWGQIEFLCQGLAVPHGDVLATNFLPERGTLGVLVSVPRAKVTFFGTFKEVSKKYEIVT